MTLIKKYILVRVGEASGKPTLEEFFDLKLVKRFLINDYRTSKYNSDSYILFAKMYDGTVRKRVINWSRLLKNEKA